MDYIHHFFSSFFFVDFGDDVIFWYCFRVMSLEIVVQTCKIQCAAAHLQAIFVRSGCW